MARPFFTGQRMIMLLRLLPGIGLTVGLAMIFCMSGREDFTAAAPPSSIMAARLPDLEVVFASIVPDRDAPPTESTAHRADHSAEWPAVSAMAPGDPGYGLPVTRVDLGSNRTAAVHSETALANLPASPAPYPYYPPDPPKPKGFDVRVGYVRQGAKQKQRSDSQFGFYDADTDTYSIGVRKDWSLDTILGLSVDMIEAKYNGLAATDQRSNTVNGYVVNAHYDGFIRERFFVDGRLWFGQLENKGSGRYRALPWREKAHDTTVYGIAASVRFPYLFWEDIRVEPEMGLEYSTFRSKAYQVNWGDPNQVDPFTVEKMNSASISLPFKTSISKDFFPCWGSFTPWLSLGMRGELRGRAAAGRAYHAASTGMAFPDIANQRIAVQFDASQKVFYEIGAGLDLFTNNGWSVRAGYEYQSSTRFHNSIFNLELGKWF